MVNIAAQIWAHADTTGDKVAVRTPSDSLTYAQLRTRNQQIAGALRDADISPGDRVLLICPSILAFPEHYFALQALGAITITMNTMSTAAEIGYVLDDSQVSLVLAWEQSADASKKAAAERDIPVWTFDATTAYDAEPMTQAYEFDRDDVCLMLYTSGTTGRPKGAELMARNLVDEGPAFYPVLDTDENTRTGTGLPLFHVFGQCVVMNPTLARGAQLSLLHPFTPAAMLQMMVEHELTTVSGVPTMWNAMLHAETDYTPDDFKHLKIASSGGAALPVEVIRAFKERFGATILEGYGLTETNGAATFNDIHRPVKPGTVGPPLPGFEVEIRSLDGEVLPAGEVGEVMVKGPTVFRGYRNRPDATSESLTDGWLHTGDLGHLDEDGYLTIVDRTKDLIIRGGYNVYPREVEEVLYSHPSIVEAAVVGVPDEHYGEEIAAVVVGHPGQTIDEEELNSFVRERLSAYKVPRIYRIAEELPKGATGKILKRAINKDELVAQKV